MKKTIVIALLIGCFGWFFVGYQKGKARGRADTWDTFRRISQHSSLDTPDADTNTVYTTMNNDGDMNTTVIAGEPIGSAEGITIVSGDANAFKYIDEQGVDVEAYIREQQLKSEQVTIDAKAPNIEFQDDADSDFVNHGIVVEEPSKIKCSVCGDDITTEAYGCCTSIVAINFVMDDETKEGKKVKDMFGETEFSICYACALKALGVKPKVKLNTELIFTVDYDKTLK